MNMKKIAAMIAAFLAVVMVLSLMMGLLTGVVSAASSGEIQTNSTEHETSAITPEGGNGVLGVGADTDDSWGPIQTN